MARKEEKDVRSLLSDLGFMFEMFKVLIHAVLKLGGTRENLKRLVKEPTLVDEIAKLIVGAKKTICSFADLIPEGWTVVEDVAPTTFDVSKLKPVTSFVKKGESSIAGEEMLKRAIAFKANLGLADGKRMLAEQDKIPVEFRWYYIPLPGTVLRVSDGNLLSVPFLHFHDGRWVLNFHWLAYNWNTRGCFAWRE